MNLYLSVNVLAECRASGNLVSVYTFPAIGYKVRKLERLISLKFAHSEKMSEKMK